MYHIININLTSFKSKSKECVNNYSFDCIILILIFQELNVSSYSNCFFMLSTYFELKQVHCTKTCHDHLNKTKSHLCCCKKQ